MKECIFCEIIKGSAHSFRVYEDKTVIAILDHRPVRAGATMILPKDHFENFTDLSDELAAHIAVIGNRVGRRMQELLKPKRIGFAVAGFGVAHVHYHVVPMFHEHDVTSGVYARCEQGDLVFDMQNTPLAAIDEQEKLANQLRL